MIDPPPCLVIAFKSVAVNQPCVLEHADSPAAVSGHSILFILHIHHLLIETAFHIIKVKTVHGHKLGEELRIYLVLGT
jgi:hypothetical protein